MHKYFPLIVIIFTLILGGNVPIARAAAAIAGTDNLEATINVPLAITDVQITGETGTVPVKLLVTSGTLAMSTTTSLTFTGDETGSEIYFSGDVDDVNAALATLTYTRTSTGADSLEVSLVEPGEVFFSDNNHLYEYIAVGGGITWTAAQTAATLLERYGSTGYLVTITSQEENDFVAARLEGAGWMGASDAAVEDAWRWVTGPETGDLFWNGDEFGSVEPGAYENWNANEPNDSGSNEDCAQFLSGGAETGEWNDLPCTVNTLPGYVVEFGADGDLPATTGSEFAITTYEAPTVSTLSPADNAININNTANLVITFNQAVDVGTGNIAIYRSINNSVVATIDVSSGQVTGSGTSTITINPTALLPSGTMLYVQIDDTAFDASAGGSYAGISDTTSWSFTTLDQDNVTHTPITNTALEIVAIEASCGANTATGTVQIQGTGATHYLLANDPQFVTASWQALTDGAAPVPWVFVPENGYARVYGALRNSSASVTYLSAETAITDDCLESEDEDTSEDTGVIEDDNVRTGPSPWNGTIELITDVSEATLIKGEHFDTVYLLENGTRRPFTSEAIFFTRFANFDHVLTVTDATLSTIPLGIPVLPKAGTLVKITSKPEVFVVTDGTPYESLRYIASESEAAQEFSTDWATLVIDIDVTLFNKFQQ